MVAWRRSSRNRDTPLSRQNGLLEAALDYAARGWPVFPCSPVHKRPLVAAEKDAGGKAIKGTGGVCAATTDAEQVRTWWMKWPSAMIGLAMGSNRLFALDFDPRVDPDTGEEWTLDRLKGELEAQIGGPLPASLAVRTPSGGVHVYFQQPAEGDSDPEPGQPARACRCARRRRVCHRASQRHEGRPALSMAPRRCHAPQSSPRPPSLVTVLQARKGATPTRGKPKLRLVDGRAARAALCHGRAR